MHVRRAIYYCLTAAIFTSTCLAQTKTGSVSGTVVGDDGKPLAAIVTLNHSGAPATSGRATGAADGSFSIKNLPAGSYSVCAVSKAGGYLNPCTWAPVAPITLTAGQNLTGYRLILKKGVQIQVRLNDSGQLLEATPARGKKIPHVIVGVMTPRHIFEPLALSGKDSNGRTHQGTISVDQNAPLYLRGNGVRLTDSTGVSVASNGSTSTVKPGSGNQPVVLTFTVARAN